MPRLTIGRKLILSSAVTALFATGVIYNQWNSDRRIAEATDAVAREQTILTGISQAQVALNRIQLSLKAVDLARTAPEADAAVTRAARKPSRRHAASSARSPSR